MAHIDTAAGRLWTILVDIRQTPNVVLRDTWARVLNVSPENSQLLAALGDVCSLRDAAADSVTRLANHDHELLLRWVAPVDAALAVAHRFEAVTKDLLIYFNDAHLAYLEMVADQVSRLALAPTSEMTGEDIAHAQRLVTELLEDLESIEDLEAWALLVRHASALERALRMYRVTGAEGVRDALIDATAVVDFLAQRHAAAVPASRLQKFAEVITLIASTFGIVDGAARITPMVVEVVRHITQS